MSSKLQQITLSLSSDHGRKIGSGYRGSRGWFSFRGNPIAFESTLERDFLVHADADTSVSEVISQPFTLRFKDTEGRQRRYTPDYLIRDQREPLGGWVIEIKYHADLVENCKQLLPGFIAARIYAAQQNMRFTVLTEKHIRSVGFTQARELRKSRLESAFSQEQKPKVSDYSWRSMKALLNGSS